jgi:hypothetical protein
MHTFVLHHSSILCCTIAFCFACAELFNAAYYTYMYIATGVATWGNSSPSTDWNKAAERIASAALAGYPGYNKLIFVEGVQQLYVSAKIYHYCYNVIACYNAAVLQC